MLPGTSNVQSVVKSFSWSGDWINTLRCTRWSQELVAIFRLKCPAPLRKLDASSRTQSFYSQPHAMLMFMDMQISPSITTQCHTDRESSPSLTTVCHTDKESSPSFTTQQYTVSTHACEMISGPFSSFRLLIPNPNLFVRWYQDPFSSFRLSFLAPNLFVIKRSRSHMQAHSRLDQHRNVFCFNYVTTWWFLVDMWLK